MEKTVFYLRVNEPRSKKLLNDFAENYNARMRRKHNKDAKKFTVKAQQLHTAKEIIRLYAVHCFKNHLHKLPPERKFWLTTSKIAEETQADYSTVQRHVNRLLEAKILLQKTFHGTNCAPRYTINPEILAPVLDINDMAKWPKNRSLEEVRFSAGCTAIFAVCGHTASGSLKEAIKEKNERAVSADFAGNVAAAVKLATSEKTSAELEKAAGEISSLVKTDGSKADTAAVPRGARLTGGQPSQTELKGRMQTGQDKPHTLKEWRQNRKSEQGRKQDAAAAARENQLRMFISLAYNYMLSILYKDREISDIARTDAFFFLRQYLEQAKDMGEFYSDFCEACYLKVKNLERNPESFIMGPDVWLNPANKWAFLSAFERFMEVKKRRTDKEYYYSRRKELIACIKTCVLDYTEDNIRKAERDLSKKKNSGELLEVFHAVIGQPERYRETMRELAKPFSV